MKTLEIIESIKNVLDVGVIFESVKHARNRRFEMNMVEFFKQLFWGKGYHSITPFQLSEKMAVNGNEVLIIDLREEERFKKDHIDGAISSPFDAFLKSVLVDQKYADDRDKDMVLVCDTGHMSRVAGSILAEEGFKNIYSLSRGMRRWNRWLTILSRWKGIKYQKNGLFASCCGIR